MAFFVSARNSSSASAKRLFSTNCSPITVRSTFASPPTSALNSSIAFWNSRTSGGW
jgi:hypothetical protein